MNLQLHHVVSDVSGATVCDSVRDHRLRNNVKILAAIVIPLQDEACAATQALSSTTRRAAHRV